MATSLKAADCPLRQELELDPPPRRIKSPTGQNTGHGKTGKLISDEIRVFSPQLGLARLYFMRCLNWSMTQSMLPWRLRSVNKEGSEVLCTLSSGC